MKVLNHINNHTLNPFAKALQTHCNALMNIPEQNNIFTLIDLKNRIDDYAQKTAQKFPKRKSEDIKNEVHSYLTFEVYSLLDKRNVLLTSIVSRRSEYEAAFQLYDGLCNSNPVQL